MKILNSATTLRLKLEGEEKKKNRKCIFSSSMKLSPDETLLQGEGKNFDFDQKSDNFSFLIMTTTAAHGVTQNWTKGIQ